MLKMQYFICYVMSLSKQQRFRNNTKALKDAVDDDDNNNNNNNNNNNKYIKWP